MNRPGRESREAARDRSDGLLAERVARFARERVPWLLSGAAAPKGAHRALCDLRRDLGLEARSPVEMARLGAELHRLVDLWNAAHPGAEVAAPGALSLLQAPPPAWTADSLPDLRRARRIRQAFTAACEALAGGELPAERLAGLALASAIFDSACLAPRDLACFALWLADPAEPVFSAPGLPPWADLKQRAPRPRRGVRPRPLRLISGRDDRGPYALRRLFLARRTLDLVRRLDSGGGAAARLTTAAAEPRGLVGLIAAALQIPPGEPLPHLRRLLQGATLLLEARPDGPDHATAMLAARRLQSFAATPESWKVVLGGPGAAGAAPSAFEGALAAPDELAAEEEEAGTRAPPVPESPLYFRLHAAIHPGRSQRGDLATRDRKLTPAALAQRLRDLPLDAGPEVLSLLRDWYLHLLEVEKLAPSSIQRYDSTVSAPLAAAAGTVRLRGLAAEDFEELHTAILEGDIRSLQERRNLRNRLGALHRFAATHPRWDFPELDEEFLAGEGAPVHVRALLIARPEIDRARSLIRSGMGLAPDVARGADAAFLLASRCGLRIGEVTKALLDHLEDVPAPDAFRHAATLFIRPSRFGDNKTPSAWRKIQPFAFLTGAEAADLESWLAHRRHISRKGPLFGIEQPDGTVAPFDRKALGALFSEALRRATGLPGATPHALRRSALTCLFLALHEARHPGGAGSALLDRLSGWSPAERARVAATVAPPAQSRDAWAALARQAGHGNAETSFSTYVMAADLAVFDACVGERGEAAALDPILAALPRHVPLGPGDARAEVAPIRGTPDQPAEALLKALDLVDAGRSPAAAASAAWLPLAVFEPRLAVAQGWAGLRTRKGVLRLQPEERAGCLAPAPLPPRKRAEALALAHDLIGLAEKEGPRLRIWLRELLADATRTNAGQFLHSPEAFRAWLAIALRLRPAPRWLAEWREPPDVDRTRLEIWKGIRPRTMPVRMIRLAAGSNVSVRVRLMAPGEPQGTRNRAPAASWAGCLRLAAHLAAIWLEVPAPDPDEGGNEERKPPIPPPAGGRVR